MIIQTWFQTGKSILKFRKIGYPVRDELFHYFTRMSHRIKHAMPIVLAAWKENSELILLQLTK